MFCIGTHYLPFTENTGIAWECTGYDEYGHLISREYYAVDGEDVSGRRRAIHKGLGYAVFQQTYEGDNWTEMRYLDDKEHLIINDVLGYAMYRREYNDKAQLVREAYYDAKGRPKNLVGNVAVWEYTYHSSGRKYEVRYYDADKDCWNSFVTK